MRLLFLLATIPAFGAITNVTVQGTTSTQAIVTYTAPTASACTVEVSLESDYTPLVEDVDPVLFPGSDSDNRTGNLINGRSRIIVIGKRGDNAVSGFKAITAAVDGHNRSRALRAATIYYGRITCGGDSAAFTFQTANLPVGDTRGEPLPVAEPFVYESVTGNAAVYPEFADPHTGVRVRRAVGDYGKFGYGGSSASWPGTSPAIPADCNKTLTGVKGSCLFDDASGTGWTATTGTLTDAIRSDDTNYAQYSGTTQQPLFVRLGQGKITRSSTGEEYGGIVFSNFIARVQTTDASGEGGQFEVCETYDATSCSSPWLRHTLPNTTEATVRFCSVANCSEATGETPGQGLGGSKFEPFYRFHQNVTMYNTDPPLDVMKFSGSNASAFCNSLYVGELLIGMRANLEVVQNEITAKNCGATPPQVTIAIGQNYIHNGTSGVGVYTMNFPALGYNDGRSNPRYGFLIRKVSTTSSATLKVGYVLYRYAVGTPFSFAFGSGGFGKRCQTIKTAQGYYLCHFQNQIVGIKHQADGTLALANYGYTYTKGSYLNGTYLLDTGGKYFCMGGASTNDTIWSDTEPGVFYCYYESTYNNPATSSVDNRMVLVKVTIDTTSTVADGDPDASPGSGPGLSNKAQRLNVTGTILTPCNAPCTSTTTDYTPYAQRKRFNSAWDTRYNNCGIQAAQGNLLFEVCLTGSQDSRAWIFAYDLGNGLPPGNGFVGTYGNTQQLIGGFLHAGNAQSRWCGMHTFQASMGLSGGTALPFTAIEPGGKCPMAITATTGLSSCTASGSGTCSPCPNVTVMGYNYSGKNWCSSFTWTSSCSSVSAPAGCTDGDPVSSGCSDAPNEKWVQTLAVGDTITHGTERMMLLEKTSNTSGTWLRGWGSQAPNANYPVQAHSNGDTWYTCCGDDTWDPTTVVPERERALIWFPASDPDGTNLTYTFTDPHTNHAWHVGNYGSSPAYLLSIYSDPTSAASVSSPASFLTIYIPGFFGGKPMVWNGSDAVTQFNPPSSCPGNACEKHPAFGQIAGDANAKKWFIDLHPRLFHQSLTKNAAPLASGKTYIRQWSGTALLQPKHFDLEVYSGYWPLKRASSLTDTTSDSGKWCFAPVADACFSGALANKVYVNFPEFDNRWSGSADPGVNDTCRDAEFGSGQNDLCVGHPSGIGAALTQWRLTPSTVFNGGAARSISKYARTYREAATENAKIDPEGKVIFARGGHYWILPPWPDDTSKPGDTFSAIASTVSGVPAGTSTAIIEFGYNDSFYCSLNYDAACVAQSATLNEATPFVWSTESITGVSCASGCTITIPALRNRVLYYRWKFRNAGGTVIHTGATQVTKVN